MGSNKETLLDVLSVPEDENSYYPEAINDELINSKIPVDKMDSNLGRVYYERSALEENRNYFYSVTTIIDVLDKGIGFARWLGNSLSYDHAQEYAEKAATVGNIVHALLMYLTWGRDIDTDNGFYDTKSGQILPIQNNVKKRLLGVLKFYDDLKPEVMASELSLYNNRTYKKNFVYPFAGQVDLVAKIDGKIWMIDYKTGKEYKHSHELQLTAYKILWDALYGSEFGKIDNLACLYLSDGWRKGPTYKLAEYDFVPEIWYKVYDLFVYLYGKKGALSSPKFKPEYPNIYTLNNKESIK